MTDVASSSFVQIAEVPAVHIESSGHDTFEIWFGPSMPADQVRNSIAAFKEYRCFDESLPSKFGARYLCSKRVMPDAGCWCGGPNLNELNNGVIRCYPPPAILHDHFRGCTFDLPSGITYMRPGGYFGPQEIPEEKETPLARAFRNSIERLNHWLDARSEKKEQKQ